MFHSHDPNIMLLGYKNYRHIFYTYGTIILLAVVGFFVRILKFDQFGLPLQFSLIWLSVLIIAVLWESLRFVDRFLDRFVPFERGIPERVAIQLVAGSIIGVIIRTGIFFFGEPYLPLELDDMFLAATWMIYIFLPAAINLGFFTVHFINRWKQSLVVAEKLEREKTQVQFDNLKNQLNPHFLFNALTSLNSLIQEDQILASQFLQQLSKVYRYVLQNKDKTMVTLETELNFIQHYVSLLETRFGSSLNIEFDIARKSKEFSIVPVTLQILIENALKHNVVDQSMPLTISIAAKEDYLEVKNNVQIRKRVEESNNQGLENLKGLYAFLSPKQVIIENNGRIFLVKVPLL